MKILLTLLIGISLQFTAIAQNSVTGKIQDSINNSPLAGATVHLLNKGFSRTLVSTKNGEFTFSDIPNGSYFLRISFVGFSRIEKPVELRGGNINLGIIQLQKGAKSLEEVVVKANTPPVQQKGDTVQFNANQFKVNPDANVEDLVKKMPGVTVDNGQVKAHGEQVKKVTVDGREFFGDDATAALRNLPAEIVDKVQVFDRLSDQAQLTGIDDGQGYKAINIVTREDRRNGQFGRVYAGYGTEDRYQGGGSVNFFKKTQRISVVGLFNNINQQNFAGTDILGLTTGGSGRGGGAGRGGPGGGGNNFQVQNQNGITKTNALGINFSDVWGKNFNFTGSYFYNNNDNNNNSVSNREQLITPDSSTFYNEGSKIDSKGTSHRVNMRMEYKIDSNNSLLITPTFNYQQNNNVQDITGLTRLQDKTLINSTDNFNQTKGDGYNFNNNILFRHSFASNKRRSFVIGLTTGINNRNSTQEVSAITTMYKTGIPVFDSTLQQQLAETKGYNLSANINYTEPLGKKAILQFTYNPSYSYSDADQRTWKFEDNTGKYSKFDTSLSNVFTSQTTTQRAGVSYRFGDRDKNFSFGIDGQQSTLDNNQTYPATGTLKKTFSNLLPNAMLWWKLNAMSNIRIFYRSGTSNPSVNQLQNVINNSNPLYFTTGNPQLEQSVSNRLGGRYIYTNSRKGNSFFVNLFATQTDNYITNATYTAYADSVLTPTVTMHEGAQLSKPVNLNGYWNTNIMLTYTFPLKSIKSNLTFNAGNVFTSTPGIINNVLNTAKTLNWNGGFLLGSNISQYVDFNINYNANYSTVKNSFQQSLDNHYFSQSAGVGLNLLSKNGWAYQTDINNQLYRGLTAVFNQNFWLWNMAVGKKFLKDQKGDLRLSVFDLLKQNRSISRTVAANYIEDVQTKVLTQYFMLTFTYKIKNFGKAPAQQQRRMEGPWGPPPGAPGGPGGMPGGPGGMQGGSGGM
ncbi:TonB-dependent receptor [Flavihumibacter profundi]|uniref:TonB-dependent receptor n=1 Tax=Flavihumibacter profundi TaxID=2716883 RepID=UPI001CC52B35|nr:TonB-dependent receptor [Flavihumibacter profundi]MBZ5858253.1 outer membrane beta-barrel protein [Flavihumibacter profundi]